MLNGSLRTPSKISKYFKRDCEKYILIEKSSKAVRVVMEKLPKKIHNASGSFAPHNSMPKAFSIFYFLSSQLENVNT